MTDAQTPQTQPNLASRFRSRIERRFALVIGSPKRGTDFIGRMVRTYRQHLEDAYQALHGSIDVRAAGLIVSACRWEQLALLAAAYLREVGKDAAVASRLEIGRAIGTASDRRDEIVGKLLGKPTAGAAANGSQDAYAGYHQALSEAQAEDAAKRAEEPIASPSEGPASCPPPSPVDNTPIGPAEVWGTSE